MEIQDDDYGAIIDRRMARGRWAIAIFLVILGVLLIGVAVLK